MHFAHKFDINQMFKFLPQDWIKTMQRRDTRDPSQTKEEETKDSVPYSSRKDEEEEEEEEEKGKKIRSQVEERKKGIDHLPAKEKTHTDRKAGRCSKNNQKPKRPKRKKERKKDKNENLQPHSFSVGWNSEQQ